MNCLLRFWYKITLFYFPFLFLKMAYEVIGAKRKYKYYKLPFLTSNDDPVKKIKFTNYDRYDRREALDEDMEAIENDPLLRIFFVAGQSSYGRMMNTNMKTFVSKDQNLTGTDVRGVSDPRLKVLMENPNSYALFFAFTISPTTKILEQNILIITLDLVVKKPFLSSLNLNFVRE